MSKGSASWLTELSPSVKLGQDGAAGGIGKGCEGGAEIIGFHRCLTYLLIN